MPHYYASKTALINMTLSLAKELANTGVTVNCVSPGIVATREILERFERRARKQGSATDRASLEALMLREFLPNPSGLVGTPEDVGNLIAFLVSERARYINAANLRIDGGAADSVH
jgi:NAD(P)-dependent dehydrogenase (short-subunit alcohol dehydrogenase family)